MKNNEKITSEQSEESDPIDQMTYLLDPLKDPQAFHNFLTVGVKIPEDAKEFNEKYVLFHKMAELMNQEVSYENMKALQKLEEDINKTLKNE